MKYKIVLLCFLLQFFSIHSLAEIGIETVSTGVTNPVAITNAGDGSGRIFVTQDNGKVRIIDDTGALLATPFLDIGATGTDLIGGQGLLSIAFHPSYASNGFFYVDYNRKADDAMVIARYSVSSEDANVADPDSAQIVLIIPLPYSNHNGGQIQFGKDGYLYIGTGDGDQQGGPMNNAQNKQLLVGKMLRIDVDHGSPYAIPADNPFVGNAKILPEIWAIGYRNPWRFSFDRLNGDMWIADVGQSTWEEINHEIAGDGGNNYGWRRMEGKHCYWPANNCNNGKLTRPVIEYKHTDGRCSITGGYRYRGTGLPSLYGLYLYADFCSGEIWSARQNAKTGKWNSILLLDTAMAITSFGEDEDGEIYVAEFNGASSEIHKLINATPGAELYSDDFEDNNVSDWVFEKGVWQATAGELANTSTKLSKGFAPYAGCTLCKIETSVTPNSKNAVTSLLAWRTDNRNFVEVQLSARSNKIYLRQVINGRVVAKAKFPYIIDASQTYEVSLRYDGTQFLLWVNNIPTLSLTAKVAPSGAIGFQVKSGTGQFSFIRASE
jgi:glucose/arabinose dehydrogenase